MCSLPSLPSLWETGRCCCYFILVTAAFSVVCFIWGLQQRLLAATDAPIVMATNTLQLWSWTSLLRAASQFSSHGWVWPVATYFWGAAGAPTSNSEDAIWASGRGTPDVVSDVQLHKLGQFALQTVGWCNSLMTR
jgi:hypothetical protein